MVGAGVGASSERAWSAARRDGADHAADGALPSPSDDAEVVSATHATPHIYADRRSNERGGENDDKLTKNFSRLGY